MMGLSAFKSVGADLRAAFQAEVLTILARIEMARRNNSPQCAAIRKEIGGRQRVRAARDMTGAVNRDQPWCHCGIPISSDTAPDTPPRRDPAAPHLAEAALRLADSRGSGAPFLGIPHVQGWRSPLEPRRCPARTSRTGHYGPVSRPGGRWGGTSSGCSPRRL